MTAIKRFDWTLKRNINCYTDWVSGSIAFRPPYSHAAVQITLWKLYNEIMWPRDSSKPSLTLHFARAGRWTANWIKRQRNIRVHLFHVSHVSAEVAEARGGNPENITWMGKGGCSYTGIIQNEPGKELIKHERDVISVLSGARWNQHSQCYRLHY
jgi:hypothetical protein